MSNIRSAGTKPERIIAKELRRRKIYFASQVKSIFGKPDFVFRRKKVVVFVDSDFWHGHPERCTMPKTNIEYWSHKIESNRTRDHRVSTELSKSGWVVIRIWEYDIKHRFNESFFKILSALGLETKNHR